MQSQDAFRPIPYIHTLYQLIMMTVQLTKSNESYHKSKHTMNFSRQESIQWIETPNHSAYFVTKLLVYLLFWSHTLVYSKNLWFKGLQLSDLELITSNIIHRPTRLLLFNMHTVIRWSQIRGGNGLAKTSLSRNKYTPAQQSGISTWWSVRYFHAWLPLQHCLSELSLCISSILHSTNTLVYNIPWLTL